MKKLLALFMLVFCVSITTVGAMDYNFEVVAIPYLSDIQDNPSDWNLYTSLDATIQRPDKLASYNVGTYHTFPLDGTDTFTQEDIVVDFTYDAIRQFNSFFTEQQSETWVDVYVSLRTTSLYNRNTVELVQGKQYERYYLMDYLSPMIMGNTSIARVGVDFYYPFEETSSQHMELGSDATYTYIMGRQISENLWLHNYASLLNDLDYFFGLQSSDPADTMNVNIQISDQLQVQYLLNDFLLSGGVYAGVTSADILRILDNYSGEIFPTRRIEFNLGGRFLQPNFSVYAGVVSSGSFEHLLEEIQFAIAGNYFIKSSSGQF